MIIPTRKQSQKRSTSAYKCTCDVVTKNHDGETANVTNTKNQPEHDNEAILHSISLDQIKLHRVLKKHIETTQ